jgi:hypothetical protein
MELIDCTETSVTNSHSTLCNIQKSEDLNSLVTTNLVSDMRKKPVKCYISSTAFYGTERRTLRKVDQKYFKSAETWCCSSMEISWTNRVKSKEELQRVKEERNTLTYLLTPWSRVLLEKLTSLGS